MFNDGTHGHAGCFAITELTAIRTRVESQTFSPRDDLWFRRVMGARDARPPDVTVAGGVGIG